MIFEVFCFTLDAYKHFEILHLSLFLGIIAYVSLMIWWIRHRTLTSEAKVQFLTWALPFWKKNFYQNRSAHVGIWTQASEVRVMSHYGGYICYYA